MTLEEDLSAEVSKFVMRTIQKLEKLEADKMISEATINPFLVKALGMDLNSLARFYVYQHIGRSLVTSFGMTVMESMVKSLKGGERGEWWDISDLVNDDKHYYISIKSGPRDMDKDQLVEFARRVAILKRRRPNATPIIAMCYGKGPLGAIAPTLKKKGLDPTQTTLTGKKLYETLTGHPYYYKYLMKVVGNAALTALANVKVVDKIEEKVTQMACSFERKYKTVDKLLLALF